jgi:WD40 repeat protein
LIAAGCDDDRVYLWSAATGELLHKLEGAPRGHGRVTVFSPDSKLLACSENSNVWLWETDSGKPRKTLRGDEAGVVRNVIWLPDDTLATLCNDRKLHVWDVRGKLLRTMTAPAGMGAFSPDGKRVASSHGACALRLWDTETGRLHGTGVLWRQGQLIVSADGHYSGPPAIREELVYVVETEHGQETLSPDEFAKRFGWKNDPARAQLSRSAGR